MSDALIRERTADTPAPEFETTPFTTPPPLNRATVAIVTTMGLKRPGEEAWKPQDPSFRSFDASERNLMLGHLSPNFDRTGIAVDLNVAYPIDRLTELAAEGVGADSPWQRLRHQVFLGDDAFIAGAVGDHAAGNLDEVPRAQRRPLALPLADYRRRHLDRGRAMAHAYLSGPPR